MKIFFNSMVLKRLVVLIALLLLTSVAVFAQTDTSFGLGSKIQILVNLVNSPWVKGIAFVALVAECIAMITMGRQDQQMFKKFIPWIAGTILFMAAGSITNVFMNTQESSADELDLGD